MLLDMIHTEGMRLLMDRPKAVPHPSGGSCSLAAAAESTGLRLRDELLATVARLAAGRNLGFDPFRIAGLAFS